MNKKFYKIFLDLSLNFVLKKYIIQKDLKFGAVFFQIYYSSCLIEKYNKQ